MVSPERANRPAVLLEWSVHLAGTRRARTAAALAVIIIASTFVSLLWHSPGLGIVAFVLLLLATSEYFFPIRYSITEQAVHCRNFLNYRRLAWKSVRSCFPDGDGIKLSPLTRPSRLEAFRGIYLRLPSKGAAALREQVDTIMSQRSPTFKETGA